MPTDQKTSSSSIEDPAAKTWSERWPVEAEVLVALAVAAAGVLAFLFIGSIVLNGGFREADESVLLALRNPADLSDPVGPIWFEELVRDLTALGSTAVLTLVVLAVAGFLYLSGRPRKAAGVVIWSAAGTALSHMSKLGFARPRPELVPHGAEVYTHSFPSGHAMLSAVIYLTLGVMLASAQEDRRIKFYVLSLAVLLTILVGMSRVYLGVHWPSDVLAGWALGASFACLGWLLFRKKIASVPSQNQRSHGEQEGL
jgi:undecaprenyl-diphosphatase